MNNTFYVYSPSLYHHGIKGQRWGVRRFQNPDGTLTAAGRRRVRKAERLHEKTMQAVSRGERKRRYKKFKKQTLKMSEGEVKELINRLRNDEQINNYTQIKMSEARKQEYFQRGFNFVNNALNTANNIASLVGTLQGNKFRAAEKQVQYQTNLEKLKSQQQQNRYNENLMKNAKTAATASVLKKPDINNPRYKDNVSLYKQDMEKYNTMQNTRKAIDDSYYNIKKYGGLKFGGGGGGQNNNNNKNKHKNKH
ncbi:MAG: hypothetical protein IKF29_00695 [Oceanobacillus sp.]|nr:hypothetical protein [Oceanobacillus sp.]